MEIANKKITVVVLIAIVLIIGLILYASTLLQKQPVNNTDEKTYIIQITETLWKGNETSDGAFKNMILKLMILLNLMVNIKRLILILLVLMINLLQLRQVKI